MRPPRGGLHKNHATLEVNMQHFVSFDLLFTTTVNHWSLFEYVGQLYDYDYTRHYFVRTNFYTDIPDYGQWCELEIFSSYSTGVPRGGGRTLPTGLVGRQKAVQIVGFIVSS